MMGLISCTHVAGILSKRELTTSAGARSTPPRADTLLCDVDEVRHGQRQGTRWKHRAVKQCSTRTADTACTSAAPTCWAASTRRGGSTSKARAGPSTGGSAPRTAGTTRRWSPAAACVVVRRCCRPSRGKLRIVRSCNYNISNTHTVLTRSLFS